ncbi:MAG: choloylglycine hydrolase family protein [Desulfomonile tiedjei]|uniref:Choloylglycine hydrolase family protein n=1 Tax=Desulfomonile tiedjei TaxID=2358 RepID=A0A9D6YZK5_9BACT|nr:choloylglycine hydrolase family protein [Desulfomonile tiedjei]
MGKRSAKLLSFAALIILMVCVTESYSCMSFRVTAKDGNIMIGRTMEFGVDSQWKLAVVPRNMQFTSPAPGGKNGLTWKNKHGYVAVVGWGMDTMVSDGLNEAGLSFGGLWYEPGVKYQDVAPGEESRALAQTMSGAWILGNFSTVDELKQAVTEIKVFGYVVPALHMSPPAHGIIYDANGKCVVMEFGDGKVNLYDNPLGILTNAPDFPWHVNHLRQFIGMSDENPKARDMAGVKLIPTGHGAGMIGLPGDLTPPSRFIRLGITTHFADKPENADKALNVSQHIVNAFNIVSGMVVERSPEGKILARETTQFATFRDLKSKVFYFQTYENLDLRKVDLRKLDFAGDKVKFINMYGDGQSVKDITDSAK